MAKMNHQQTELLNGGGNKSSTNGELVNDFNSRYARFWMNVAIFHNGLPRDKMFLGLMALVAWMYGGFALVLVWYIVGWSALWSFKIPPQSQHESCSSRLNVLLGRSWRISQPSESLCSNNNVSITRFKGSYFTAYRNADRHWPSQHASMLVAKAPHPSGPWEVVWQYKSGEDLREMLLFEVKGILYLYYCAIDSGTLGTFNVKGTRCFTSEDGVEWSVPASCDNGIVCRAGELIWDVKVVMDDDMEPTIYKTSYMGGHYQTNKSVEVLFEMSRNGMDWTSCGSSKDSVVYRGGVCEVAFEFTKEGDLVGIGRLEDGDDTGFGSQLFFASAKDLGTWTCLQHALPWRFDSPRMCRVEATGDVLLFARYAYSKYAFMPKFLPLKLQEAVNMIVYSVQPKTSAVYRLLPPEKWKGAQGQWDVCSPLELVRFFEHGHAVGDTGFFSVVPHPTVKDSWYVANYSAVAHSHAWWVSGQLAPSHIYVAEMRVEVEPEAVE